MKVKVSVDSVSKMEKPPREEISTIKRRTAGLWQEIELKELADLNGNKGHAIIPAHLEGGMKTENCMAMQLLTLDFDDGCTFAQIKRRCDDLGLKIAYAYHTLSASTDKEKFRVVFVCEEVLEDLFIIRAVLRMLHKIFPECDKLCKNPDRMFFGGKGLFYTDLSARMALVQLLPPLMQALDVGKHFSENQRRFASETNIALIGKHLAMGEVKNIDAILGENVDSAVIHKTDGSTFSPIFMAEIMDNSLGVHQGYTCGKVEKGKKRKIKKQKGSTQCQLLNDFKSGIDLGHDARFAICTNLIQIHGGEKYFFKITEKYYEEETYQKWKADMKFIRDYFPKRCSPDFCPYFNICEHEGTIVDTLLMDRQVYLRKETYVTVDEAEKCLRGNLQDAFCSTESGMHLIKAQTGLGKTREYVRLIADNQAERFLIALPTNQLKEEVKKRLVNNGVPERDIFMTASVHGNAFIPPEMQTQISEMHNRGIHNMTKEIINDYYEKIRADPLKRKAVEEECEKILAGIKGVKDERVIVTTHAYLAQLEKDFLKNYTVIIDEDFLQLLVFNRMYKVSVKCLEELAKKDLQGYSDTAAMVLRTEEKTYTRMKPVRYGKALTKEELGELGNFQIDDNINDLIHAGAFVRMQDEESDKEIKEEIVKYFCPLNMPEMKYIVLSATFDYEIYRKYFAGQMEVYTYPEKKAAYRGQLEQYTYHSLGRKDLSKKEQVFSIAKEMAGKSNLDIITFKKFENEGEKTFNAAGIHFGNSTGLNELEGHDLAVIGTPYRVEEYYKLIACYLGAEVNQEGDKRPSQRRAEYKGNSFLITTYKDKVLREVQLYSIESELEQCVGRARLLRQDCSVYVFSCFPCEQAKIHIKNYLQDYEAGEQAGSHSKNYFS